MEPGPTIVHNPDGQILSDSIPAEAAIKLEPANNDEFIGNGDDDEDTYKSRPQLPKPAVHMRSLADLMSRQHTKNAREDQAVNVTVEGLENGTIDVDPEYQREVVWTADRMTGLVNSLMENFYIPPIILNRKTNLAEDNSRSGQKLVCVDGKQRLSSVRAFVKGMIPCHDYQGQKWWFCDSIDSNRRRKTLPEEVQRMFLDKDFVAFEFTNLSSEQEEDLFARVQMGLQLTLAEKMRASTGPWQELARLFADDFPNIYSLMKDRARAKDFQLTVSCFSQILEVMHPTAANGVPVLKTNYAALPKFISNKGVVDDGIRSHLANIWNTLKDLLEEDPDTFTNSNKYLRGVQTFAPVEMVAVTVLISMYSETRNNRLLLGDIRALREALRERFVDLRLNISVWKFTWAFLESLEDLRGVVDSSTIDRRVLRQPQAPVSCLAPTVPSGSPPKADPIQSTKSPEAHAIKNEEENSTALPPNPRLPKRKRTDPQAPSLIHQPNGTTTSSYFPIEGISIGASQLPQQLSNSPVFPPMPTHDQPRVTTQRRTKTSVAPSSSLPKMASHRRPFPTRDRSRSTYVSEMEFGTPFPSAGSTAASQLMTAAGAFAPAYSEQHWDGLIESVTSPTQRAHPMAPSFDTPAPTGPILQTRARQQNQKFDRAPFQAQEDDVIDLTSDTELEQKRQDLLSAFTVTRHGKSKSRQED